MIVYFTRMWSLTPPWVGHAWTCPFTHLTVLAAPARRSGWSVHTATNLITQHSWECTLSQTCFSGVKAPSSGYQQPWTIYELQLGLQLTILLGPQPLFKLMPPRRRLFRAINKICLSWNGGKCILPGSCEYSHICATCHEAHCARDCSATPEDSMFKRSGTAAKRFYWWCSVYHPGVGCWHYDG